MRTPMTALLSLACVGLVLTTASRAQNAVPPPTFDRVIRDHAEGLFERGRQIFRYDTFGDEVFWGDTLKLHQAIAGAGQGGVGPGVSPRTALAVGLKVDVEALPAHVLQAVRHGRLDLDDPAVTLALLDANAVVGVKGFRGPDGRLSSVGIQCSFCHSTVDDSFAPGVGRRLDGWPNRDLNVGAIIALAPDLRRWPISCRPIRTRFARSSGAGAPGSSTRNCSSTARRSGRTAAARPPSFPRRSGWPASTSRPTRGGAASRTGTRSSPTSRCTVRARSWTRGLNDPVQFPVAARAGFGNVRHDPDLVTSKLPALQFYQLSIPAPRPSHGSFDPALAEQGKAVFNGAAGCASCHVPPLFTEPGWNMHTPEEIGIDDFQASRSPDRRYRTTPLAGLSARRTGGFYHDGRFANLRAVVEHYNQALALGLTDDQKVRLVEYLKSL